MKYEVLFGSDWQPVEDGRLLEAVEGNENSVGWLKFTYQGTEYIARKETWREIP